MHENCEVLNKLSERRLMKITAKPSLVIYQRFKTNSLYACFFFLGAYERQSSDLFVAVPFDRVI